MNTIIGHTGFVGSNLCNQINFNYKFNSKNINEINLVNHDIVYCCGISGEKFWANKNGDEDKANISLLINQLKDLKCNKFILISTIDVYSEIRNKNEDDLKSDDNHHLYGKNRYYAESEFKKNFGSKLYIVRLPALFGDYLKKNAIFDLINRKFYDKVNVENKLQLYYASDLANDIDFMLKNNIHGLNLFTEPISIKEIIERFFVFDSAVMYSDIDSALVYDLKTKYTNSGYWKNKDYVIENLRKWLKKY